MKLMNGVSTTVVLYGSIAIAAFLFLSLVIKQKTERGRLFLFWGMTSVIIFVTAFITLDTIFKNIRSVTGGPVHWHADYKITVCGGSPKAVSESGETDHDHDDHDHQNVDLVDPTGLANRVGDPVLHEHGDGRIHIEGTVESFADITLAEFFETTGGQLSNERMVVPTNEGLVDVANGASCPSGSTGTLQVFRYRTEGSLLFQDKLDDFSNYVISPHTTIPPGDCLILEFGEQKDSTESICDFLQIALNKGDLRYESTN